MRSGAPRGQTLAAGAEGVYSSIEECAVRGELRPVDRYYDHTPGDRSRSPPHAIAAITELEAVMSNVKFVDPSKLRWIGGAAAAAALSSSVRSRSRLPHPLVRVTVPPNRRVSGGMLTMSQPASVGSMWNTGTASGTSGITASTS